jgi:sulfoxide reductase heme-binding subunit YedZ
LLAVIFGGLLGLVSLTAPAHALIDRLSTASAWICTLFFCAVLLIGPVSVITGRPAPTNHLLRRDLGIWTAVTGLLHFWLGTEEAMNTSYLAAFVSGTVAPPAPDVRQSLFTWGSLLGFVIGLLFLLLMGLSNNVSLRRLGGKWWKRLQRSSYFAFAFTVLHGFAFQILENRHWVWVGLLGLCTFVVAALQGRGFLARRRVRVTKPAGG